MRTRSGITYQQSFELKNYLGNLSSGKATAAETAHALVILREYRPGPTLTEWCNGVAHKTRDRGDTAETGMSLLAERLQIDRFFAQGPTMQKVPKRVFESLLETIQENDFGLGGVSLRRIYPQGYSLEEIIARFRFAYRLDKSGEFYRQIKTRSDPGEDLQAMSSLLPMIRSKVWGLAPWHFDDVFEEVCSSFSRLVGKSASALLRKNKDLFTLHFLCCFHLTEIKPRRHFRNPCYLTLDETASEQLSLNLSIYEREDGGWEQMELSYENRGHKASSSHSYSRPYLVTDLAVAEYFEGALHDRPDDSTYRNALIVKCKDGHPRICRIMRQLRRKSFV